MQSQLKIIRTDLSKGKSSTKVSGAADELHFLMNFNSSITQAMAKTLEHLSDFVFVTVANTTLAHRTLICHISSLASNQIPWLPSEQLHSTFQLYSQMKLSGKLNRTLLILKARISFTQGRKVASTYMNAQTTGQTTGNQTEQPGKILETVGRTRKPGARPLITPPDQPRASSHTNNNYCVNSLQGRLLARSQDSAQKQIVDTFVNLNVVPLVHTAPGPSQKKENKSRISRLLFLSEKVQSKICERCFLCHPIVLCQTCTKCQKRCHIPARRGQTSKLLANLAESRGLSENSSYFEGGLHPPLSDPAKLSKVSHYHKPLCKPTQEQLPDRGGASAYVQKCC